MWTSHCVGCVTVTHHLRKRLAEGRISFGSWCRVADHGCLAPSPCAGDGHPAKGRAKPLTTSQLGTARWRGGSVHLLPGACLLKNPSVEREALPVIQPLPKLHLGTSLHWGPRPHAVHDPLGDIPDPNCHQHSMCLYVPLCTLQLLASVLCPSLAVHGAAVASVRRSWSGRGLRFSVAAVLSGEPCSHSGCTTRALWNLRVFGNDLSE